MAGREGWVPASFLLPGTKHDSDVSSYWTTVSGKTTSGLKYVTMAEFNAQNETDLTLPECAVVEVVTKSPSGWWKVRLDLYIEIIVPLSSYKGVSKTQLYVSDVYCRYGKSTGLVPASLLAMTDVNSPDSEISEEEKVALAIVSYRTVRLSPFMYICVIVWILHVVNVVSGCNNCRT